MKHFTYKTIKTLEDVKAALKCRDISIIRAIFLLDERFKWDHKDAVRTVYVWNGLCPALNAIALRLWSKYTVHIETRNNLGGM
ncbi:MAG: hypothetical protein LBK62_05995 [Treponema sp.]|jgi:hypothetical protein|nr:hypothetical protein [Treponema sp.]